MTPGLGTALKPASEPIVVARKPLAGTVAANVLKHGTGALNIDVCRTGTDSTRRTQRGTTEAWEGGAFSGDRVNGSDSGRWPTNVVLSHAATPDGQDLCVDGCVDGCPVAELDTQSGTTKSRSGGSSGATVLGVMNDDAWIPQPTARGGHDDTGGASRFFPTFRYQAKAPTRERPRVNGATHPTVKPLALIRFLCRLACPPDGLIVDPFLGSGTTMEAALLEGFRCMGSEGDLTYLPLVQYRLDRIAEGEKGTDA